MKAFVLAFIAFLWPGVPASAGQWDVVLSFPSLAAAKADPVVRQYRDQIADLFAEDRVLPDVKVWRNSQDVGGVHTYLPGRYILVSLDRVVPALRDHPAVTVVIDREKARLRQVGAIVRSTVSAPVLQDIRWEPIFSGADYPFGSWQ